MTAPHERSRPSLATEAAPKVIGATTAIIARAEALARVATRPGYVVRVAYELRNGRTRVIHYASLPAAVRTHDAALARGCAASIALCRVEPVALVEDDTEPLRGVS